MQVQKIQNNNYNPQFNGILKVQNFKKGGKVTERLTSDALDKVLYEKARNNLFNGEWTSEGSKNIQSDKLSEYIGLIKHAYGISLPKSTNEVVTAELKNLFGGYSVRVGNDYKITHVL